MAAKTTKKVPFIPCQGVEGQVRFGTEGYGPLPAYYKPGKGQPAGDCYNIAAHPGCVVFNGFALTKPGMPFAGLAELQQRALFRAAHRMRIADGGRSTEYYLAELLTAIASGAECMGCNVVVERTMTFEDTRSVLFNLARLAATPEFSLLDGADAKEVLCWASAFAETASFFTGCKAKPVKPQYDKLPFMGEPAGRGYSMDIIDLGIVKLYGPEAKYSTCNNTWVRVSDSVVEAVCKACDDAPLTKLGEKRKWPDELKQYVKAFATIGFMRLSTFMDMVRDTGARSGHLRTMASEIRAWHAMGKPVGGIREEPEAEPAEEPAEAPRQAQPCTEPPRPAVELLPTVVHSAAESRVSLTMCESDVAGPSADIRLTMRHITPEAAAKVARLLEQLRAVING